MKTLHEYLQAKTTCLMAAASSGKLDVVQRMVEIGGKELLMQADTVSVEKNSFFCQVILWYSNTMIGQYVLKFAM